MRVLLSTYGSRGDVEPMMGLAVQLGALGAATPPSAADCPRVRPSWSPPSSTPSPRRPRNVMRRFATGVMPTGGWR